MRPHRYLHADAAGYLTPAPTKMKPADIPLTLSADVLRLPYTPAVRLVLAEVVSLFAATGLCDASDAHFAARLTISTDSVNRAVKELEAEGLLVKVVDKSAGFYRTLVPVPAAITAKAATNPYPQNAASYPQNAGRGATRKTPVDYPQNAAPPTRNLRHPLPAECGTNTPLNLPGNFQETSTPQPPAADAAGGAQKKIGVVLEVEAKELPADLPPERSERPASHTRGARAAVVASVPGIDEAPASSPVLMRSSPLAAYAAFEAAWQAAAQAYPDTHAPYDGADLRHYHGALLDWSNGGGKKKCDWLATIRNSMRRDLEGGKLRKAPLLPGVAASSPVMQRLATAEAALALNEYDDEGNRTN